MRAGELETLAASAAHLYLENGTFDNKAKFWGVKRSSIKLIDRGKDNDNEFEWH